ncbi:phospholipase D family protein [Scandinavium goeteborgense]|uniref:phospholipase D n=1 Tax=Scandinavium goeteborgense TaxID=1851514 RepID=A0A4R6DUV9_SCAGO|nr:phospholipase D family protein [Scandinavium goeteborgense]TDN48088.1 phospholipase D-like protein [Scandinavium goeteborgense]
MKRPLWFFIVLSVAAAPALAEESPAISVGFSPSSNHDALNVVLNTINDAKKSIDVAAYVFTSKPVARALVEAKGKGIFVRVVADEKSNKNKYTAVTYLANHGIPVRLNNRYSIMHNKTIVADGHTVQTGSFNYTSSADKSNAENAIAIKNVPELASQYEAEFNRLWDESTPLKANY